MGAELGRISGPLLASNLRRDGQDLWFADTDLTTPVLYLDVNNGRIGINNDSPTRDLLVSTTTNLQDDLQVDTKLDIASLTFLGHEVSALTGNITIRPNQSTDPEVVTAKIGTANLRISDKLVENITLDSDINLTANGSGLVKFTTTTVDVDGYLHATGNITFDGDVTLGSGADDNVEFGADVNSHIIPDDHDAWDLGSPTQRWKEIFVDTYNIGTTTVDNISVIQTLLSKGNTNFSGPSHQFGNDANDSLEFNGTLLNSWIPNGAFTFGNNSTPLLWDTGYFNELTIDGITNIQNNTVTTLTTDTDLELSASGTGKVHVTTAVVQIDNNLTVDNILTVNGATNLQDVEIVGTTTLNGDYQQTGNTFITGTFGNANLLGVGSTSYLQVTSIKVDGSEISATVTNSDLVFTGATTGGVILDQKLKVVDSTISNVWASPTTEAQKSIFLTPDGTGLTVVNSTKSLVLPLGNITTRSLSTPAELRYNTDSNLVEGYVPSGRFNLNNLYDGDRNTYITPELTPGASDDTIRFGINGTVKATITPAYFKTNTMHVDDINISGTTIAPITTSNDLTFLPTGTGSLDVNGVLLKDNSITNATNGALTFSSTGTGYVKFMGSGAVAIPYGDNAARPAGAETGELRYSTEEGYLEVYDGINWIPSSGTSLAASEEEVAEIMNLWAIILG